MSTGASEISYPDPAQPEHSQCLRCCGPTAGSNTTNAHRNDVRVIYVSADNSLKLTVHLSEALPTLASGSSRPAQQPTVLVGGSQRVPSVVQWLAEPQSWKGYTAFKQGQHHVQTNAAVMALWWFAVEFSEHYSHMLSPVQVSKRPTSLSELGASPAVLILIVTSLRLLTQTVEDEETQDKSRSLMFKKPWVLVRHGCQRPPRLLLFCANSVRVAQHLDRVWSRCVGTKRQRLVLAHCWPS